MEHYLYRMYRFLIVFLVLLQSCFLFGKYKRSSFSYTENGVVKTARLVVPKGYSHSEIKKDSAGNEIKYFYYGRDAFLYFARLQDTSTEFQPIIYDVNIPRALYNTIYFKGIDADSRYWRETRFDSFKSGYRNVKWGRDGRFDSSINYFSLHLPVHQ
jgi:hypothetical protein